MSRLHLNNLNLWRIHSTFTLPDALNKKVGVEVPHPGIDKYTPGEKRVYHKYYQWVCFVLFLQAIMFYIPRYLWKMWEGRRLRSLVLELDNPIMTDEARDEQIDLVVDYFRSNLRWKFFLLITNRSSLPFLPKPDSTIHIFITMFFANFLISSMLSFRCIWSIRFLVVRFPPTVST